jgi:hypothetical protein
MRSACGQPGNPPADTRLAYGATVTIYAQPCAMPGSQQKSRPEGVKPPRTGTPD